MKKILHFVAVFFAVHITLCSLAQKASSSSPAQLLTTIPFKILTGGIIILPAQFESTADTLNFILDTGSGGISLDSATADYFKVDRSASSRIVRGIGGVKNVDFIYNCSLKLNNLIVDSLDFHINDYDLLSSVYGIKIDGIIGYSFLKRYIVSINYEKQLMEVYSIGSFKYPKGGQFLYPSFSSLPMQKITVKDNKKLSAHYYFDIGAGLCMLFSRDFAKDSMLLSGKYKQYSTQVEGIGGKQTMTLTAIKEVRVGSYKFKKVPVYIFEDNFNLTAYPQLGGLIGNDILRRFNIVLNYAEQCIYIKPNNHYNDAFDYSYTGLGIYIVDGKITVEDVMKDSPSDNAGFKKGDIIVAVGSNFSGDIQVYKALLQNLKASNKVVIMRDNILHTLKLAPKNILEKK